MYTLPDPNFQQTIFFLTSEIVEIVLALVHFVTKRRNFCFTVFLILFLTFICFKSIFFIFAPNFNYIISRVYTLLSTKCRENIITRFLPRFFLGVD